MEEARTDFTVRIAKHLPNWSLAEATPLEGGSSEEITELKLRRGGEERRIVCRAYGEWSRTRNPKTAQHEYALRNAA